MLVKFLSLFLAILGINRIKNDIVSASFGWDVLADYVYCLALSVAFLLLNRFWNAKKKAAEADLGKA